MGNRATAGPFVLNDEGELLIWLFWSRFETPWTNRLQTHTRWQWLCFAPKRNCYTFEVWKPNLLGTLGRHSPQNWVAVQCRETNTTHESKRKGKIHIKTSDFQGPIGWGFKLTSLPLQPKFRATRNAHPQWSDKWRKKCTPEFNIQLGKQVKESENAWATKTQTWLRTQALFGHSSWYNRIWLRVQEVSHRDAKSLLDPTKDGSNSSGKTQASVRCSLCSVARDRDTKYRGRLPKNQKTFPEKNKIKESCLEP